MTIEKNSYNPFVFRGFGLFRAQASGFWGSGRMAQALGLSALGLGLRMYGPGIWFTVYRCSERQFRVACTVYRCSRRQFRVARTVHRCFYRCSERQFRVARPSGSVNPERNKAPRR